jgi:hypothetical protein
LYAGLDGIASLPYGSTVTQMVIKCGKTMSKFEDIEQFRKLRNEDFDQCIEATAEKGESEELSDHVSLAVLNISSQIHNGYAQKRHFGIFVLRDTHHISHKT